MSADTYLIRRFHRDEDDPSHRLIVKTGLSLEEAREHCQDESTHAKDGEGTVIWFDGYEKE